MRTFVNSSLALHSYFHAQLALFRLLHFLLDKFDIPVCGSSSIMAILPKNYIQSILHLHISMFIKILDGI